MSAGRRCRLCASHLDAGVMIFGDRGHHMMLRDTISKYLHIEISLNDKLPKMVCISCCTQIDSIRIFAEMAYQSQYTLSKQLEEEQIKEEKVNNQIASCKLVTSTHDEDQLMESNSDEENTDTEEGTDVTEMEVKLDPMLFLDSHTDDSQTNDSKNSNNINSPNGDGERATLTKIENNIQIHTNQISIKLTDKNQSNKSLKVMPDLKPIKKFLPIDSVRPFECMYCPRSFLSSIALQNHSWLHVNKQETELSVCGTKIKCPICRKEISRKTNLKVHLASHNEKYNCDICGRIFKTESNLLRHKEYHGGEVFTCGVCGRVYPTNSTLRAHSVTHSDARPHNCPLCKKTFKRNQDLKFHINQHTGERPYRCPYCPKAFASSGNCFSHRKRMHPAEVERDREKSTNQNPIS